MTDLATKLFERFPEGHTAHIPLHLIYNYSVSPEEAYGIKMEDVDFVKGYWNGIKLTEETVKLLKRQQNRILAWSQTMPGFKLTGYFVIDPMTGKQLSSHQYHYISKVIRREFDPGFTAYHFSQKLHSF